MRLAGAAISNRQESAAPPEGGGYKPPLPDGEITAAVESVPLVDGMAPLWPDESAESAMVSELRSRGEVSAPAATEAIEETDTANLPPLDQLVKRIPPEVREALDDLFRAKFVRVTRVPRKALKD